MFRIFPQAKTRDYAREDALQGPALADATTIYISYGFGTLPWGPGVLGASTSLDRMIVEHERRRIEKINREGAAQKWAPSIAYESVELYSSIYELPLNIMIPPRRAKRLYGVQRGARDYVATWGPLNERVAAADIEAARERDLYRQEHRDSADPIAKIVQHASETLPQPAFSRETVFVVNLGGVGRRRIGIFTTYPVAFQAAPEQATIHSIRVDGRTPVDDSNLIRGRFASGWGYASGYGPNSIANQHD